MGAVRRRHAWWQSPCRPTRGSRASTGWSTFKARTVNFASAEAQESSDWDIIGSAEAWEQVMAGEAQPPQRRSLPLLAKLRYCDSEESDGPLAAARRNRDTG